MNIKINNRFTVKSDSNNFIVEEYGTITSKNKDTGFEESRIGVVKTTYHPSLDYSLRHIVKQAPADENVDTLEIAIHKIEETYKDIERVLDV